LGKSYASQAFLITKTALRRETLLGSIQLSDSNTQSIRMQAVRAAIPEKEVIDPLAFDRVLCGRSKASLRTMRIEANIPSDFSVTISNSSFNLHFIICRHRRRATTHMNSISARTFLFLSEEYWRS
jgi:hypothetical protein